VSSELIDRVMADVLAVGKDDYVGLWQIWDLIRRASPGIDDGRARHLILQVIQQLLDSGRVAAGFPTSDGGFLRWSGANEEILARISTEWEKLSAPPNIGEVVWLNSLSHDR